MRHLTAALFFLTLSQSGLAFSQPAPSFDCDRARTKIEKKICGSEPLANLDRIVASEYKRFLAQLPPDKSDIAKSMQRIWINNRGKGCADERLEECLKEDHYHWINSVSKGVLVSRYRDLRPGIDYVSPFDKAIKFKLEIEENTDERMEGETRRSYKLEITGAGLMHEGEHYEFGQERYIDMVAQIVFFLSKTGVYHLALQKVSESYGGQCGAFTRHSLDFIAPHDPRTEISSITLYEEDGACDTYEKQLFRWDLADNGNLRYYETEGNSFYVQEPFVEIKVKVIDSPRAGVDEYYYIDKSERTFLGVPYAEIIDQVRRRFQNEESHLETKTCKVPGYGLDDYLELKRILSQFKLGFHQIEFYTENRLNFENLRGALRYKPLLEAGLKYLEHAKAVTNWQAKLVEAARKYPQIEATSNYYYSGDSDWDVNPFIAAGFHTDKDCFSQLPSPWGHASMEEWYYLFWARRVNDGYLERAEGLLKTLINLMKVHQVEKT